MALQELALLSRANLGQLGTKRVSAVFAWVDTTDSKLVLAATKQLVGRALFRDGSGVAMLCTFLYLRLTLCRHIPLGIGGTGTVITVPI